MSGECEKCGEHCLDCACELFCDGQDSPAHNINSQYKQQPGNSRKCIECGKTHDTIVEDIRTGERIEEIDKCRDCLFKDCFVEWGGTLRGFTSDGRNVNLAEELNRLEEKKRDEMDKR